MTGYECPIPSSPVLYPSRHHTHSPPSHSPGNKSDLTSKRTVTKDEGEAAQAAARSTLISTRFLGAHSRTVRGVHTASEIVIIEIMYISEYIIVH